MSSSLLTYATVTAEGVDLAMPPVGFGVVSITILMFLLLVTLGFRSVGTRFRDK